MSEFSLTLIADAIRTVERMSLAERERLADEIYLRQPNLLASVLVLHRMGVSLNQLEVPIFILLVVYQAMNASGLIWPVIQEDIQERCLQRLTGSILFSESLSPELRAQAEEQRTAGHRQRNLLAFVYGYLGEHDLLSVRSEAEKYLLLASLNLVECVAATAPEDAARDRS